MNTFALPSAPYVGWASSDLEIFDENILPGPHVGGAVGSFNGDITNIIPNLTVVGQTGGARPLYSTDPASQAEDKQQAEDVEWAHAMAPEANLVLIEGLGEGSESVSMAATVGVEAVGGQEVAMIRYTSDDQIVQGISRVRTRSTGDNIRRRGRQLREGRATTDRVIIQTWWTSALRI